MNCTAKDKKLTGLSFHKSVFYYIITLYAYLKINSTIGVLSSSPSFQTTIWHYHKTICSRTTNQTCQKAFTGILVANCPNCNRKWLFVSCSFYFFSLILPMRISHESPSQHGPRPSHQLTP